MSRLTVTPLTPAGLALVQRQYQIDERGFLSRVFCAQELAQAGWIQPIAQINHTQTRRRGAVRGLHYQHAPHAESKLVSCLRGEVWDVAVDLRADSPSFLQWHAEQLSATNGQALLIPAGFAHGFQALTDDVELLYCHSEPFVPDLQAALNVRDPRLAIDWPIPITQLSQRDATHPHIDDSFVGERL